MSLPLDVHGHTRRFNFQCQRIMTWFRGENEYAASMNLKPALVNVKQIAKWADVSERQAHRYAQHLVLQGKLKMHIVAFGPGFWYEAI